MPFRATTAPVGGIFEVFLQQLLDAFIDMLPLDAIGVVLDVTGFYPVEDVALGTDRDLDGMNVELVTGHADTMRVPGDVVDFDIVV